MKTMNSKYPGTCAKCGEEFGVGCRIVYLGRGQPVTHEYCPVKPGGIVGPCWECQSPEGRFRNYGAATPVRCDACEEKLHPKAATPPAWEAYGGRAGYDAAVARHRRFVPDPIDMAYEDTCAAACGPGL